MNSLAVSVRVASDVVEDLSRSGEWRFRVHNPVGLARRREVTGKGLAIGQGREGPGEAELPRVERVLKRLEQQPAKQAREHPDGQEEAGAAGDPTGAIGGQAAPGHDAVQMRMMDQRLPPRYAGRQRIQSPRRGG